MDLSADTFQLVTEIPADTIYAAVSYRWGTGKDVYMLTQKTEERMRRGVSTGILPKTILDTITIAHRLNLKYIWIDRLCILQDSPEDWSREASRMALVYKHAFLTISASCASDEKQGCFRKRNEAGIQPLRLISNPLLTPIKLGFYDNDPSYITSDQPEENQKTGGKLGHLADRGWVFQERILSLRIVHFAEEEVYWECRKLGASESWPDGGTFWLPSRPRLEYGLSSKSSDKYRSWHRLVEDYSAYVFTYDGDKLPALSGLASETAELRKDASQNYLAGLWRSTVLLDLCWSNRYGTLSTPEHYLAPSWSWASLHGNIVYDVLVMSWGYKPVAEFKDACLSFAADDTYGAVHDGWIHLFGHLKPVTVAQRLLPGPFQHGPWDVEVHGTDGGRLPFLDHLFGRIDIETFAAGEKESVPMFCLPLLQIHGKFRDELCCLLLVPNGSIKHKRSGEALPSPNVGHSEQYQRAGMARIMTLTDIVGFTEWLDESPERDIIIR